MLDKFSENGSDAVFNIAEGGGGRGRESQVRATLEMLGVHCTGSDPVAIGITLDKALAKLMAKAHGIATAPWVVTSGGQAILLVRTGEIACPPLRFPLFVKP